MDGWQDSINLVRGQLGERIAELQARVPSARTRRHSARMDAIRTMAAEHGLAALEGLADWSAHHAHDAGLPDGDQSCLEHMGEALDSNSPTDRQTILAALRIRLH